MQPHTEHLRPDSKGRVCLGNLAAGVSSFRVEVDKNHRIILEPYAEMPGREVWLFQNKDALNSVLRGVSDAKNGKVKSLGSFARYVNNDIE